MSSHSHAGRAATAVASSPADVATSASTEKTSRPTQAGSPDHPSREPEGKLGSVFWTSVAVSTIVVAWSVLFTDNLNKVTGASLNWVTGTFGWTYLVVTLGILIFLVFLAFSPAGDIRLGKDTDRPEFSTITWFAMILSAVMGIGLVSYGVAEPISHFATPPHELA